MGSPLPTRYDQGQCFYKHCGKWILLGTLGQHLAELQSVYIERRRVQVTGSGSLPSHDQSIPNGLNTSQYEFLGRAHRRSLPPHEKAPIDRNFGCNPTLLTNPWRRARHPLRIATNQHSADTGRSPNNREPKNAPVLPDRCIASWVQPPAWRTPLDKLTPPADNRKFPALLYRVDKPRAHELAIGRPQPNAIDDFVPEFRLITRSR